MNGRKNLHDCMPKWKVSHTLVNPKGMTKNSSMHIGGISEQSLGLYSHAIIRIQRYLLTLMVNPTLSKITGTMVVDDMHCGNGAVHSPLENPCSIKYAPALHSNASPCAPMYTFACHCRLLLIMVCPCIPLHTPMSFGTILYPGCTTISTNP
jgi:hypothetical protein